MVTTEQGPSPVPPTLFEAVGPSVDDWEKYLRNMSEGLDEEEQPETSANIFLQVNQVILSIFYSLLSQGSQGLSQHQAHSL